MVAPCPPPLPPGRPRQRLPEGSVDCHIHVTPPGAPLAPGHGYVPAPCTLADYRAVMAALGIARAVLVQPSIYGTDNRALLAALAAAGPGWRGVAVLPPEVPAAALAALDRRGVRGVRLNTAWPGGLALADAPALAARIAPLGWHLQFLAPGDSLEAVCRLVPTLPVPCVIDHLGLADPRRGPGQPGFRRLLGLVESGRCWVKLSAPYRVGRAGPPHADLAPLVAALLAANPERLVWGSDWPHVDLPHVDGPAAMPDDADLADLLAAWVPDAAARRRILVDNPAALYGPA
ncbi:MAG: amidohydrolase family protein [Dongiaceae bacterium]